MERLLNTVARFATLLTRTPTPHDLLNTLMRDFLSNQCVTAIEIQMLAPDGSLLMNTSVGLEIDGDGTKDVKSLSSLISHSNIFRDLEETGSIFDPAH